MAWFPFFVDLTGKHALVVGGGKVALRKVRSLLDYGARVTVVAERPSQELLSKADITLVLRAFRAEDLTEADFVIAATDGRTLNSRICALCRQRGLLVNSADGREDSSFLFPALVHRGQLSIGISTAGASPSAAAHLRTQIDGLLPEKLEEILEYLESQRTQLRQEIPEQTLRLRLHKALYEACIQAGRPLTALERQSVLGQWEHEGEETL